MEPREALRKASVQAESALSAADVPVERLNQIAEWYGGRYTIHLIGGRWMANRRGEARTYTTWQLYMQWLVSVMRSMGDALCMPLLRVTVSLRGRKGPWALYRNLLSVARSNERHVHHRRYDTKGVTRTSVSHNDVVRRIGVGPSSSGRMDCGRRIISLFLCMWLFAGRHKNVIRIHRPGYWEAQHLPLMTRVL